MGAHGVVMGTPGRPMTTPWACCTTLYSLLGRSVVVWPPSSSVPQGLVDQVWRQHRECRDRATSQVYDRTFFRVCCRRSPDCMNCKVFSLLPKRFGGRPVEANATGARTAVKALESKGVRVLAQPALQRTERAAGSPAGPLPAHPPRRRLARPRLPPQPVAARGCDLHCGGSFRSRRCLAWPHDPPRTASVSCAVLEWPYMVEPLSGPCCSDRWGSARLASPSIPPSFVF